MKVGSSFSTTEVQEVRVGSRFGGSSDSKDVLGLTRESKVRTG